MLVRKLKEEWKPSENVNLKVGEVIEITDPRILIKMGIVEEVKPENTLEWKPGAKWVVEPTNVKVELVDGFICNKCSKEFKNASALRMHQRFCKL